MIILGFDPSLTQFGWAVHDTSAVGLARCPERGRFKTGNETLFIDRYTSLRDQVRELVCRIKPDKLGIESPVFGELYSEGMYGLFLYVCEAMRLERQDFVLFSPMQTKAHARICLGRAPDWKMMKPDMVSAAIKDTGGKGKWNHNEADAYWAAVTGGRFWQFQEGTLSLQQLTPTEQQQFARIHTYQRGKHAGETEKSGLLYREDDRFFRWSKEDK